jgi:hypothetical protein
VSQQVPVEETPCDPTKRSAESPIPHEYRPDGEEYGSLADGGSYERLTCRRCGRTVYVPLPD